MTLVEHPLHDVCPSCEAGLGSRIGQHVKHFSGYAFAQSHENINDLQIGLLRMSNTTFAPVNVLLVRYPRLFWLLAGGLAYYATARLGMAAFSLQPSNITLLWLPAGIGLVLCLWAGKASFPVIFLASYAANAPGMELESLGWQIVHTTVAAAADTFAAGFAAAMMRRKLPTGLNRPHDLIAFSLFVCLVPTLISAGLLASNLALGGYINWSAAPTFIGMLLIADSLGMLLVIPLIDAWKTRTPSSLAKNKSWLMMTLLIAGLIHLAFSHLPSLIFLIPPALIYLVFRESRLGLYLSLILAVCFIIASAAHHLGPFLIADQDQARLMLVVFLFSVAFITIGMVLQQSALALEQKKLAMRTRDLEIAKEFAETANRAKTSFLSNMSHELRTPMNFIMGLTGLAKRRATDPKQIDQLDKVEQASDRLLKILNDVIEFSDIKANRLDLAHQPFAVEALAIPLQEALSTEANNKGLKLRINFPPEIARRQLFGDPERLGHVLAILVGNAIKFSEKGVIDVRLKLIEEMADALILRFEIQDEGIGIAPENRKRIFNAFEQVDGSMTRKYGGNGLGLSISQRLVKMMGGTIGVDGALGQGSTFWFTVRLPTSHS